MADSSPQPLRRLPAFAAAQATTIYRRRIGAIEVTAISDGYVDLPHDIWKSPAPQALDDALHAAFLPTGGMRQGLTCYLVNTGRRLILMDGGAAGEFGEHFGELPQGLAAAGVAAEAIDLVLVSHLHPDHIGGLFRGTAAAFPKARLLVDAAELAFWTSTHEQAQAVEIAQPWFDTARRWQAAWGERIETFSGERSLGEGLTIVPLPGHTVGHFGLMIESEGARLLIANDLVFHFAINFQNPDAAMIWETDSALAARTRRAALDQAATDRLLVAASHLPFPSFGHVERRGTAFAWAPEPWQHRAGA